MTQSLEALRMALKPFRDLMERIECTSIHDYSDETKWDIEGEITVGELRRAREAYASLSDQSAGDGWKMVPMEPTQEMLDALHDAIGHDVQTGLSFDDNGKEIYAECSVLDDNSLVDAYKEMLAALPASSIPVDRRAVLEEAAKLADEAYADCAKLSDKCETDAMKDMFHHFATASKTLAESIRSLAASPSLANDKETPVTVDPLELGLEVPFFERSPTPASKGPMEAGYVKLDALISALMKIAPLETVALREACNAALGAEDKAFEDFIAVLRSPTLGAMQHE